MSSSDAWTRRALIAIGAITAASGAAQAAVPGRVLRPMGVRDDGETRHLFGTVGMFMVVSGGALVHGLTGRRPSRAALTWAVAQKLGAAVAVALGVRRRIFSPLALGVAAFDLASGLLALRYRRHLGRP